MSLLNHRLSTSLSKFNPHLTINEPWTNGWLYRIPLMKLLNLLIDHLNSTTKPNINLHHLSTQQPFILLMVHHGSSSSRIKKCNHSITLLSMNPLYTLEKWHYTQGSILRSDPFTDLQKLSSGFHHSFYHQSPTPAIRWSSVFTPPETAPRRLPSAQRPPHRGGEPPQRRWAMGGSLMADGRLRLVACVDVGWRWLSGGWMMVSWWWLMMVDDDNQKQM